MPYHHEEAYLGALCVVITLRRAAAGADWSNELLAAELSDSRVRDNLLRASAVREGGLSAVVQEIGASGFVAETIPVALEVARLMETVGVEPALEELIRLGGDTDTIGSIAGQIWGVATGGDVKHLLREVPNASLVLEIAGRFAHFAASA